VPFDFVGLLFKQLFVFFEFLISYRLFPIVRSCVCFLWVPCRLKVVCRFGD
jgi:hypothetical protein